MLISIQKLNFSASKINKDSQKCGSFFVLGGFFRLPLPLFCFAALHKKSSAQAGPRSIRIKICKIRNHSYICIVETQVSAQLIQKGGGN